jgi:hypothetical protein
MRIHGKRCATAQTKRLCEATSTTLVRLYDWISMAPWTLRVRRNTTGETAALSNAIGLAYLGMKTNIDAVQSAH